MDLEGAVGVLWEGAADGFAGWVGACADEVEFVGVGVAGAWVGVLVLVHEKGGERDREGGRERKKTHPRW